MPRPEDVYRTEELEEFRRSGYWSDVTMWQLVEDWATADPERIAFIDDHRSITIGEVADGAKRLAGGLYALGVRHGDRVVVQLTNRVEAVIVVCGLARLGAVLVPVQPLLRRHDVAALLNRTRATAMFSIATFHNFDHVAMIRELRRESPELRKVIIVGDEPHDEHRFDELLAHPPYEGPVPNPDDPLLVMFTSGTTSAPKGCVHTSNTFMNAGRATGVNIGAGPNDVVFMPSPIMHMTGMGVGILMPLIYRIPSVFQSRFEPLSALELIGKHRCTMTLGASAFATMLLDAFDPKSHDVSTLRVVGLGGAPVQRVTIDRLDREFGCQVIALYGSTEGLSVASTRMGDDAERTASSDGQAVDGVELVVTDDAGNILPPGQEGEIRFRAPGRFLCYWEDDERTRSVIDEHGRFRSGDLATIDANGYLRITGRLADMIIRGGVNISAQEVENLLIEHPDVLDIAVVSMPDARLGEKMCAFVVPGQNPPTVESLAAMLLERGVAKFKFPERVEVLDVLPRNPTGKIEKFKLRSLVRELLLSEEPISSSEGAPSMPA